jgi:catechol 2,3-dioxygenase-like lactoylglutathione lyase family enzyme
MTEVANKPVAAIRVTDLDVSLAFYTNRLGFTLVEHRPAADLAWVDAAGYSILLAGPAAGDLTPLLSETHQLVPRSGTVHVFASDLDECQAELRRRDLNGARMVERSWGDCLLMIRDPDGHTISFWTLTERRAEEGASTLRGRSGGARRCADRAL